MGFVVTNKFSIMVWHNLHGIFCLCNMCKSLVIGIINLFHFNPFIVKSLLLSAFTAAKAAAEGSFTSNTEFLKQSTLIFPAF